jgi:hypothetical protein
MRNAWRSALAAVLLVGACSGASESNLNPFNWFGGSDDQPPAQTLVPTNADPRPMVDQVVSLTIDRTQGGAIIRATGLPPTQGWWEAELVEDDQDDPSRLVYRFVIVPPVGPKPVSTPQSREVTVATFLSDIALEEVREITVTGARNARSVRR